MGMLGRELVERFTDYNPLAWDVVNLDITKRADVLKKIIVEKPDLLINAAAYTDVNCSEKEEAVAAKVNGEAVGYLAEACQQCGVVMVHYSTDYVFDGTKKYGYEENDAPNPINAYGRTKFLGEQRLQKNLKNYYLIRTSWLFGRFGPKNFVQKIIKQAEMKLNYPPLKKMVLKVSGKMEIPVVDDCFGKPTNAYDLARATREIINEEMPFGIYHVTNETREGGIYRFEYAKKIIELSKLPIKVVPVSSTYFTSGAKHPPYGALINTKLPKMREWEEALREYLNPNI